MKIGIFDATTQENTVRDMTADELADYEIRNAEFIANKNAKEEAETQALAARTAAEAKLAALGLTTDDLKALGLGTN
jgi:hypothetical protein